MQLVLEIKNERDLAILLPLLERLNITVSKTADKGQQIDAAEVRPDTKKNFDVEQLERLFDELQSINAFAAIENPAAWQKQLRDEWN